VYHHRAAGHELEPTQQNTLSGTLNLVGPFSIATDLHWPQLCRYRARRHTGFTLWKSSSHGVSSLSHFGDLCCLCTCSCIFTALSIDHGCEIHPPSRHFCIPLGLRTLTNEARIASARVTAVSKEMEGQRTSGSILKDNNTMYRQIVWRTRGKGVNPRRLRTAATTSPLSRNPNSPYSQTVDAAMAGQPKISSRKV
jgi:hypothetical protein